MANRWQMANKLQFGSKRCFFCAQKRAFFFIFACKNAVFCALIAVFSAFFHQIFCSFRRSSSLQVGNVCQNAPKAGECIQSQTAARHLSDGVKDSGSTDVFAVICILDNFKTLMEKLNDRGLFLEKSMKSYYDIDAGDILLFRLS